MGKPYAVTVRLDQPIGPGWVEVVLVGPEIVFNYLPDGEHTGEEITFPKELGRCPTIIKTLVSEVRYSHEETK